MIEMNLEPYVRLKAEREQDKYKIAKKVFEYMNYTQYIDCYYDFESEEFRIPQEDVPKYVRDYAERHVLALRESLNDLKFYTSDYTRYIELHNEHTLWKIDKPIDDEEYFNAVAKKIEELEEKFEVDFYLLGRSGRHCCVEFNEDNLENYNKLKEAALEAESEIVKRFNQ